jgi:hypothetical protein
MDYGDSKRDPWKCKTCGKMYVVPGLARDCEQRHAKSKS